MSDIPLEADIENAFVDYAHSINVEALKLRIDGENGFPDRTVITRKGVFFVEFKRTAASRLRPRQRYWRRVLVGLGFPVLVTHSTDEAVKVLNDWLEV